jgi:hypothetical protein
MFMDYQSLKQEIAEIATIASGVPDKFQDRCFDALLQSLLAERAPAAAPTPRQQIEPPAPTPAADVRSESGNGSLPLKAGVRAFMQRANVTAAQLGRVMMHEDNEIHFMREPEPTGNAEGQIQWALLLALRNGILNNSLSVDAETVRSMCQEKGFYDRKNFSAIFKRSANLFRAAPEPQGEAQPLSTEGQEELGRIIRTLAGDAQ